VKHFDKGAYYLIALIFIISFNKGVLELIGVSSTVTQLTIEVLIIILFLKALPRILQKGKMIGVGLLYVSILLVVTILSFLLSNVNILELILFFRKYYLYILFFYALFNIRLSTEVKDRLIKLLIILFLIQIPAAFIKLIVLGGTLEKIVGTISVGEGSLATTMPLLAIVFLISNYLIYKKIKYAFLILLFIAIGLISNKMGILFYVGIMFVTLTYIYSLKQTKGFNFINIFFIKKMSIISILLVFIFAAFVSLNPRANPENVVGGSIDLEYLAEYVDNYQNLKIKSTHIEGEGRFDAPIVAYDRLERKGISSILLGFGPGDIIKSMFSKYDNPLLQKYNIGYGGRLGLVQIMMQIGFIGVLIFTLFHLLLFKKVLKTYWRTNDKNFQVYNLTAIGLSIYFFLEFYTYSSGMLQSPGVTLVYYFAMYYVLSKVNKNQKEI
jgi:hypothetical protein